LDVITKYFPVTFCSSFAESLSSFASAGHFEL
jgi:hypothetical protein